MTEDELKDIEARCEEANKLGKRLEEGIHGDEDIMQIAEFTAMSLVKIPRLVAEVRRLNAENFQLASWQCVRLDGSGLTGDDHGHQYCQLDKEVRRLREERDALSELADALGTMCGGCFGGSISYRAQDRLNAARKKLADAKAALEGREGE